MSRWISNLPPEQVPHFAACELVYRTLLADKRGANPLGQHFDIQPGYAFKSADYSSAGIRLLRNINVKPDRIDWADSVSLPASEAPRYEAFRLASGDLVLSMDGTVNKQGIKLAFLRDEDVPSFLLQRVCRIVPKGGVSTRFVYHMLHSMDFLDHLDESNRSIAIPHVSAAQLKSFPIPLVDSDSQDSICTVLDAIRFGEAPNKLPRLPASIADLRRVIAAIVELAGALRRVATLKREQENEVAKLLLGAFLPLVRESPRRPMKDVAPLIRRPIQVFPDATYSELGIRSFGKGTFHKPEVSGIEIGEKRIFHIEPGDLLFSNVFAWEGAIAVAEDRDRGRVGSHRFITCVPRPDAATARFLCFYFLTQEGLELIRAASPGGALRNRTLGLNALANIKVPCPPIEDQMLFDMLQARVGVLRDKWAATSSETEALLPAFLDRAFKGELV